MIPLVLFTSNKKLMGQFVNRPWVSAIAWIATISLTILNIRLIWEIVKDLL
jgi:manganese transport protein